MTNNNNGKQLLQLRGYIGNVHLNELQKFLSSKSNSSFHLSELYLVSQDNYFYV